MAMNQQAKDQLKSEFGLSDSDLSQGNDTESIVAAICQKTGQDEAQVRSRVEQITNQ